MSGPSRRLPSKILSIQQSFADEQPYKNQFQISRMQQSPNTKIVEKTKDARNPKVSKLQSKLKKPSTQQNLINISSMNDIQPNTYQERKQQKADNNARMREQNSQQQEQAQVHGVSQKKWLTLSESLNLSLGHFNYTYNFPIRRQIPIIANNLDLERQKYQNGTYISQSFDNNLRVSFALFFFRVLLVQNFLRSSVLLWIVAIIFGFSVSNKEQYGPGKQVLLTVFLLYCIFAVIFEYLSLRNRRIWQEPSSNALYKVYHYDNQNHSADWIDTNATDLRPGNIYKIHAATPSQPSVIPVDSILLHGPRTIVQLDQSPIMEYLSPMQKQQSVGIKQVLLKSKSIKLPLTGVIHYQLEGPQILEQNIYGKFILQEPTQETLDISYNNVVLRGSRLLSSELFFKDQARSSQTKQQYYAIVLETGIDSLVLKTAQFPYQFRNNCVFTRVIDIVLIVCSILYILVLGSGILIGYIYFAGQSIPKGDHIDNYLNLGQQPVSLSEIVCNHFANLIIIIPIMLRVVYLLYIFISGLRFNSQLNVQLKDMHMLAEAAEAQIFVTTIGSDLVKMGQTSNAQNGQPDKQAKKRNRNLQSIRVGKIHHNFLTTSIQNEMYRKNDVQLIRFFMTIGLLTCDQKKPSPLQKGILERCNELNLKVQKFSNVIKIQDFKVSKIFTIPPTERYPFKIQFFRHGKDIAQDYQQQDKVAQKVMKQKILVIVRGQTSKLTSGLNEAEGRLLKQFSSKLHQQKGLHIQLLGRFLIQQDEFNTIKNIYGNNESQRSTNSSNPKLGISQFYTTFDKYLKKIDAMGLLIWQNPYHIISDSLLPISSLTQLQYKIIIAPPSKSLTNPQFQSIHAITNYLLKASKFPLKQISSKILHHYTDKQTIWALLQTEKIIVLNGWDYRTIKKMLTELKEIKLANRKEIKLIGYIEQDQYAWVLKQTDVSICTQGDGNDLQKYADIIIGKDLSDTTTKIIRRIILYSKAYSYGIAGIILVQFMKGIILATVQFINLFFTWGTGLVLIGSSLYFLLEIGLLFDFLYYFFPFINEKILKKPIKKGQKTQSQIIYEKSYLSLQYMIRQFFLSLAIGVFISIVCIYSLVQPISKNGVVQPKQFTHIAIHFIIYHSLIFRKIFMRPFTFSVYKLFILLIQIGIYYLGLIIISAINNQSYKGIIWYVFSGRLILVCLFMIWMIVGVYWITYMIETIMKLKLKVGKKNANLDRKQYDAFLMQKEKLKEQPIQND